MHKLSVVTLNLCTAPTCNWYNFNIVKPYIMPSIDLPPYPVYVCPLCFGVYGQKHLNLPEILTLEHIIPEKMGGRTSMTTLTCKECNNNSGKLEGKYIESQVTKDAMAGMSGAFTKTEYSVEIDGK